MKTLMKSVVGLIVIALVLAGCTDSGTPAQQAMADQNQKKAEQAAKVMAKTQIPSFNESVERDNIRDRLVVTNNPNSLQWIYLFSAGRTIGRFPVRGKVTSGSKRMTSTQMLIDDRYSSSNGQHTMEAPDEMGTYGSSSPYIFWFDPAGNYQQWQGDYFLSPVPYQIDKQYGTVSIEVDKSEETKRAEYQQQIKANPDVTKVKK